MLEVIWLVSIPWYKVFRGSNRHHDETGRPRAGPLPRLNIPLSLAPNECEPLVMGSEASLPVSIRRPKDNKLYSKLSTPHPRC